MYSFRIYSYKNGQLTDFVDPSYYYPTKREAVQAAQYAADAWHLTRGKCKGELQRNESGATRWWTDEAGNRYRREYKAVKCQ